MTITNSFSAHNHSVKIPRMNIQGFLRRKDGARCLQGLNIQYAGGRRHLSATETSHEWNLTRVLGK